MMVFRFVVLVLSAGFLFGSASYAESLTGIVVGVTDGDTITVLDSNNLQHEIRLAAIDAPETTCRARTPSNWDSRCIEHGQPFGKAAKRAMTKMVFGKQVTVELAPGDSYGREIGTVFVGGLNVNLELVRRGYAWVYDHYARSVPVDMYHEYLVAQRDARTESLGLWGYPSPQPPWDYRRGVQHASYTVIFD